MALRYEVLGVSVRTQVRVCQEQRGVLGVVALISQSVVNILRALKRKLFGIGCFELLV